MYRSGYNHAQVQAVKKDLELSKGGPRRTKAEAPVARVNSLISSDNSEEYSDNQEGHKKHLDKINMRAALKDERQQWIIDSALKYRKMIEIEKGRPNGDTTKWI